MLLLRKYAVYVMHLICVSLTLQNRMTKVNKSGMEERMGMGCPREYWRLVVNRIKVVGA